MGEAKRRGTFEQRKAEAIRRNEHNKLLKEVEGQKNVIVIGQDGMRALQGKGLLDVLLKSGAKITRR